MQAMEKTYFSRVSGDFTNYAEALAACPSALYAQDRVSFRPERYEAALAKLTPSFSPPVSPRLASRLAPYLIANSFFPPDALAILDIGGGDGRYFRWQRAVYGEAWSPHYDIIEAPEVAAYAGAQPHDAAISYFDEPEAVSGRRYSYIVFGSMLSILEDPWTFFDRALAAARSELVLITNFPLLPKRDDDRLCVKDIGRRSHPYWLFSKAALAHIERHGTIVVQTMSVTHAFEVDGQSYPQRNLLIRRTLG